MGFARRGGSGRRSAAVAPEDAGQPFHQPPARAGADHVQRPANGDPALGDDLAAGSRQPPPGPDLVDAGDGAVFAPVRAGQADGRGLEPGLLVDFPGQGLVGGLAGFEASAGELPIVLLAGFDEENLTGVQDDRERGISQSQFPLRPVLWHMAGRAAADSVSGTGVPA